ncbi:MAG: aminotransferase class III-fold pyridoxal phosphate-dependent enzyme [Caldilinea sp. CFX5]|nr:aminotransferase class III-fold pyridoxal phosphate-dependent enzyme [Caldilinea sp. CFX5]
MSLVQSAPRFTAEEAIHFGKTLYNINATATALTSERDQNFLLTTAEGCQYVLKVANAQEAYATLALQNLTLQHVATHSTIPVAHLQATLDGQTIATVTGAEGASHFVRLLTYLPGKPLGTVKPHAPELLHNLGEYLGKLDKALATFDHPAASRLLQWDLKQAGAVINQYKGEILDPARRQLVEQHLAYFEQYAAPLLPQVRTSIIHNDGNDYNVLVGDRADGGLLGRNKVITGVIDFGDMVRTYTVSEPAIAAAYAMLDKADPLAAAADLVRGYHAVYPLTETEIAVLYPLICMRLCMSVCISAHQQALQPENRYLSISEAPAWVLLEKLATLSPDFAHYTLRHACGLEPHPQTPHLIAWLQANRESFAPVIDYDLRTEPVLVFDLSIGSPLVADLANPADAAAFTERLFADMRRAGVKVGVGRYNEPRLLYAADAFRMVTNERPERRTVHLAIDLFLPAGAPIYAPLAGAVHSFANNANYQDYGPTIILQHTIPLPNPPLLGEGAATPPPGWGRVPTGRGGGLTFYTLYGHLSEESLADLYPGKIINQGEKIGAIGDYPINGDWPPHLHFQLITDLLGDCGGFNGVGAPSQRAVWLSLCPDPNLILQIPATAFPETHKPKRELLATRHKHLGRNLSISYKEPLHIVRAAKQFLYDIDGYAYLDVVNNVCHVGHCHPHVVRAAQRQMAVLNTNTRYVYDGLTEYAERLCATLPEPLRVCFFVNSGSEANDLALRLARAYTGRYDTICLDVAYHGNLNSLIDISPYKFAGPGGKGAPPTTHIALMPDPYRGVYQGMGWETGAKYAEHVRELVAQVQAGGKGVAAFIAESVLGCGGQIVLPDGYLTEAYKHVRATGGICIADEVQVGFGRVGTHFWGFETQGVVPDIVTMGKPIGNGHPLGAVVTTPEIADAFANGMEYFNTFGGNPVSCAVGLAVLDVIEQEGLQAHSLRVGNRLMAGLRDLMRKYPLIGDVRGLGLFVGVELVLDRERKLPAGDHAAYVANRMRDHGILISTDGPDHNVLKLKPPIVFDEQDADRLVATLDKVLAEDAVKL